MPDGKSDSQGRDVRQSGRLRGTMIFLLRTRMPVLVIVALAVAACGCNENRKTDRRSEKPGSTPSGSDANPAEEPADQLSPMATILCLRELRSAGRYSAIERHLRPGQRVAVMTQLRAGDRLVATARLLRRRVEERFGLAAAQEFDYRAAGNVLGVFSNDVTLVSEQITADRARVTFQVASRLPLESVDLVRSENRWVLVADPIDGVPEQLYELADLLERLADAVQRDQITLPELRSQLALRQRPILRRIQELVKAADPASDERESGQPTR